MARNAQARSTAPIFGEPSLSRFTSTSLATEIGAVTREVMKRGAAIITRHDSPVMVLVSIDRYNELERAATPDLAALTSRFDAMYARMQAPHVGERTIAALDLEARSAPRRKSDSPDTSARRRKGKTDSGRTGKSPAQRRG